MVEGGGPGGVFKPGGDRVPAVCKRHGNVIDVHGANEAKLVAVARRFLSYIRARLRFEAPDALALRSVVTGKIGLRCTTAVPALQAW
jgi:hypothetical protein